jgi:hypothetical protein
MGRALIKARHLGGCGFIDGRRITHDLAEFFGRQYFTRRCLWRMQTPQKPQERLLARRKQVWKNA